MDVYSVVTDEKLPLKVDTRMIPETMIKGIFTSRSFYEASITDSLLEEYKRKGGTSHDKYKKLVKD